MLPDINEALIATRAVQKIQSESDKELITLERLKNEVK